MILPRLKVDFFQHDVLEVTPALLGKTLVRKYDNQLFERYKITEVEAYRGTEDLACHASKGKTARTEVMFGPGGRIYVYLIYGMYWMLNVVTGKVDDASAVLVRGLEGVPGPGRVGKKLKLDKSFYGENLSTSKRIWIEDSPVVRQFQTAKRVGIEYAGDPWANKKWRFILKE